jgi:hypothetical protein
VNPAREPYEYRMNQPHPFGGNPQAATQAPTPPVEPFRPMLDPNGAPAAPLPLYSSQNIVAASLFGGPVAGAFLLFMNYRRRGLTNRAWLTLLLSFPAVALLMVVGAILPDHVGNYALPVVSVGVTGLIANADEDVYRRHKAAGAPKPSIAAAIGITVLALAVTLGAAVLVYGAFEATHQADFGHDQTVTFEDGATMADAQRVGEFLKKSGYFSDTGGASVHVSKAPKGPGWLVDFAVLAGAWGKPEQVSTFSFIGRLLGAEVFPHTPVTIRMCDDSMKPKKTIALLPRAKLDYGHEQVIIVEGEATDADANALSDYLKEVGFFGEGLKGKDVNLRRQKERVAIGMIVGSGKWEDATLVQAFERIRAGAAQKAFSKDEVTLELMDDHFEAKKTLGP